MRDEGGRRPSEFNLLVDPPASGAWNMAVDEALLEAATEGRCTLRFYQWDEPTLSLGYFQQYADRQQHPASLVCPIVRRSSGGGAILHDRELTYSLAIPESHPLAATRLRTYQAVHQSLIETLGGWGIRATICSPAQTTAAEGISTNGSLPFLCFQRRSSGDVLIGDIKIAGSAQRRCQGAVLQHGSVLLARSAAAPELAGLFELTGRSISVEELIKAWSEHLAASLRLVWHGTELPEGLHCRADGLLAEKYGTPEWTERRGRVLRPI